MAAVMTSQLGKIDKITFFMEECKALGLNVLGPDVNESQKQFSVNKKGDIRFGMGAIKGSGDAAVDAVIEKRAEGNFTDIFDFITRVNLRTVNKKTLESFAYAGAFDCFSDIHRAQYFDETENTSLIEKIIKYANKYQENKDAGQNSLFGGLEGAFDIAKPKIPECEKWGDIQQLKFEKEVVGFYISGHPLDQFRLEMRLCVPLDQIFEPSNENKEPYYKLTNTKQPFFYNIRIKSFLSSYARCKLARLAMENLDNVIRTNMDCVTFTQPLSDEIVNSYDNLTFEEKSSGSNVKWEGLNKMIRL
jgi:DNA polymerase-3 subunit alpha